MALGIMSATRTGKTPLWGLFAVALVSLAALIAVLAWPSEPPPNLLIVSIDTLRADHLGCYGYDRPTSPTLDALAERGVVFEAASTPSPWTKPAHASLFTGKYPSRHGAIDSFRPLSDDTVHLASLLTEQGFDTAAVVNVAWLTIHGLSRGFQHVDFVPSFESPEPSEVTEKSIAWFDQRDREKPFFALVHYFDVHSSYQSLPQYEQMFVDEYVGPANGTTAQLLDFTIHGARLIDRDIAHISNLYDAGIRQLDDQLAKLFAYLEENGELENTVVVITSDHGEELFDHGSFMHGFTQYEEVARVPLVFFGPGVAVKQRIGAPVSLVDVMPTCLKLMGIAGPEDMDGVPLDDLWRGAEPAERALFYEADNKIPREKSDTTYSLGSRRAIRRGDLKLHYDIETGEKRLFDLAADPLERTIVNGKHAAVADAMLEELLAHLANPTETEPGNWSDDRLRALRQLGYVGGETDAAAAESPSQPEREPPGDGPSRADPEAD
ncbi:MAG: DUF229 domain-containing protein [Planctomycetota bacterium]|nr:MAG: DUF229 domain-containing protein [Planctomycetota bacterium]REK37526.1 MAG: DUF229 domain-containing protein [Planctomycetota bacterium]